MAAVRDGAELETLALSAHLRLGNFRTGRRRRRRGHRDEDPSRRRHRAHRHLEGDRTTTAPAIELRTSLPSTPSVATSSTCTPTPAPRMLHLPNYAVTAPSSPHATSPTSRSRSTRPPATERSTCSTHRRGTRASSADMFGQGRSRSPAIARSAVSARCVWLVTVPGEQPMRAATCSTDRSSQYRRTTAARCLDPSCRRAAITT